MKVLLISDDRRVEDIARAQLAGKAAKLHVEVDYRRIEKFINSERPEIIINTILDQSFYDMFSKIRFPRNYEQGHDFESLDFYSQPIEKGLHNSLVLFLQSLPISDTAETSASPFVIRRGRAFLRRGSKPRRGLESKAKAAYRALTEAKEALAGLGSFEEHPSALGNRVAVPLSQEALQAIDRALDAGIALADSPVVTSETATPFKTLIGFFQNTEKVLKQVEKAATTGLKAAGVLAVLAAAITAVVGKLQDLLASLGLGG